MSDSHAIEAYVDAAAKMVGLPLDPRHRDGVIRQFSIVAGVAQLVTSFPLPVDIEPATVLRHD